jgi:hypothetical protein
MQQCAQRPPAPPAPRRRPAACASWLRYPQAQAVCTERTSEGRRAFDEFVPINLTGCALRVCVQSVLPYASAGAPAASAAAAAACSAASAAARSRKKRCKRACASPNEPFTCTAHTHSAQHRHISAIMRDSAQCAAAPHRDEALRDPRWQLARHTSLRRRLGPARVREDDGGVVARVANGAADGLVDGAHAERLVVCAPSARAAAHRRGRRVQPPHALRQLRVARRRVRQPHQHHAPADERDASS